MSLQNKNSLFAFSTYVVSPLTSPIHNKVDNVVYTRGNSGASNHYICPQDEGILTNLHHIIGKPITLPNANTVKGTRAGILPFAANLSEAAKWAKFSRIQKFITSFTQQTMQ